jgi:hypothetical protein
MPPVPWLLTDGEAGTPACGRVAFHLSRLSDERVYVDGHGNEFRCDGEEQIATLEVVGPRWCARLGDARLPFHLAGSLSAYSLDTAWFDGLRNTFEKYIGGGSDDFLANRDLRGRELAVDSAGLGYEQLLDSTPVWRLRGALKVPLPDARLFGRGFASAWSLGLTLPALGERADSSNGALQVDTTLAWALPLSRRFRFTGAANLALPGESEALDRRGVAHETLVWGAVTTLEWWASRSFCVAVGFTVNGPYTQGGRAPTDLPSYYVNLGFLWRPTPCAEVHLLCAENPGGTINSTGLPSDDYDFRTQRDADFSLTFGGSLAF